MAVYDGGDRLPGVFIKHTEIRENGDEGDGVDNDSSDMLWRTSP